MKTFVLFFCMITFASQSFSQKPAAENAQVSGGPYPQLINVGGRNTTALDGLWKTIVDPYENGYYDYRRKPLAG